MITAVANLRIVAWIHAQHSARSADVGPQMQASNALQASLHRIAKSEAPAATI
jgi:hypothetical protein